MRKELEWYNDRDEEIILIGTYFGKDAECNLPLFIDLTNLKTEESIDHIHVLNDDILAKGIVVKYKAYIIRGYVKTYTRKNKTTDYGLKDVIIEEI